MGLIQDGGITGKHIASGTIVGGSGIVVTVTSSGQIVISLADDKYSKPEKPEQEIIPIRKVAKKRILP